MFSKFSRINRFIRLPNRNLLERSESILSNTMVSFNFSTFDSGRTTEEVIKEIKSMVYHIPSFGPAMQNVLISHANKLEINSVQQLHRAIMNRLFKVKNYIGRKRENGLIDHVGFNYEHKN